MRPPRRTDQASLRSLPLGWLQLGLGPLLVLLLSACSPAGGNSDPQADAAAETEAWPKAEEVRPIQGSFAVNPAPLPGYSMVHRLHDANHGVVVADRPGYGAPTAMAETQIREDHAGVIAQIAQQLRSGSYPVPELGAADDAIQPRSQAEEQVVFLAAPDRTVLPIADTGHMLWHPRGCDLVFASLLNWLEEWS